MQLAYHPAPPGRRAAWKPAAMRGPFQLSQTNSEEFGIGDVLMPIIRLGAAGAVAYVGMHAALNQKGMLSALGWVAWAAGFFSAFSTLGGLFMMGATPKSSLEPVVVSAPTPAAPTTVPSGPMEF